MSLPLRNIEITVLSINVQKISKNFRRNILELIFEILIRSFLNLIRFFLNLIEMSSDSTHHGDQSNPFLHSNLPLNSPLSPYLNINPEIFKEPQYIMPEGSAPRRGRFELAFSTIGGAAIAGAVYGGGNGIFRGLKDPAFQNAV